MIWCMLQAQMSQVNALTRRYTKRQALFTPNHTQSHHVLPTMCFSAANLQFRCGSAMIYSWLRTKRCPRPET